MFTEMRRKKQAMPKEEVMELLLHCPTMVMAVNTEEGYPYTVPLNFAYSDNKIYFHCSKKGLKLDSIKKDSRVSIAIIGEDTVLPSAFATDYTSLVIFGEARLLEDDDEKISALRLINHKYSADYPKEGEAEIKKALHAVGIVEVAIQQITGKVSGNRRQKNGD